MADFQYPSWLAFYWRDLLNRIIDRYLVDSGVLSALPYLSNDGTTSNDSRLASYVTRLTELGATSFSTLIPPATAKAAYIPSGRYQFDTFHQLSTYGTGTAVRGDTSTTVLDGLGFRIVHNKYNIRGLTFFNDSSPGARPAGYIAFLFNGPLRGGQLSDHRIFGYETGIFRNPDFASFEEWSGIEIEQCTNGVVIGYSSFQASRFNVFNCDDYCLLVLKGGEIKWNNSTFRGAGIANMGLLGTRGGAVVECYWNQITATGADPITFPVLAINDVGGFGQLVIGTEIVVSSIASLGSIMTLYWNFHDDGAKYFYAADLVRVLGTSGQCDSITVGAVELLSAPVVFNGTARQTCTDIVAAINAGTATHGFTSKDANTFFYISDETLGTLGATVVGTTSGGDMTVIGQAHVAFTTATPHGFVVGDWTQSDCVGYEGCEPIRHVISPTEFVWHIAFTGTAAGLVWRPHFYTTAINGMRLIADGYNEIIPALTAVSNVTLTTDIPFADISALTNAVTSTPGNDVYIDTLDGTNLSVNDQFFGAECNFNRTFVAGGTNIVFDMCRLKNEIIIVPRANTLLHPQGVMIETPARGRADETLAMVPVGGAAIGWMRKGYNLNGDSDSAYAFVQVPARDLPIINGIPQVNETRWYRNRIEELIGDEVIATWQAETAVFAAGEFYHPDVANINRIRIQDAPAGAGPIISVVSSGDTPDTNDDLRLNPLGTGRLRFGIQTASADAPVNGYIEVRTAAGALVKIATIA